MYESQENGGLVLGAYDTINNSMVGFLFGFVGFQKNKFYHYSSLLAVYPNYRSSNIGYHLKLVQRQHVLAQGMNLVKWTFDPLANLHLGAVS